MSERYASDSPLPGGVEQYFDTLIAWLKHVREHPSTHEELVTWITQAHDGSMQATTLKYAIMLVSRMGLWVSKDGVFKLTQEAIDLLEKASASPDEGKRAVLDIKLRDVAGYDVLLKHLSNGGRSLDELDTPLKQAIGADWKTKAQTGFRLSWLRSLGYVEKEGRQYRLTERGQAIASGIPAISVPSPTASITTPPSPVSQTELVSRATAVADRIDKAATCGGDGCELEQAAAEAFSFLGYTTGVIGGSGNPDIVASARMGEASYRLLVETKSRSGGVVNQNDVNFNALKEHKAKSDADYIVVVGADFAGGNLEKWSREHEARLVRAEELRQVLLAHAEAAIPLDTLQKLWSGGGPTDEAVLSQVLTESENTVQSITLARAVYMAVHRDQDEEGVLDAHSLYYILQREYSIQAIEATIGLLQSELIGALGRSAKGSLYTRMAPRTLNDRLAQIGQIMGSDGRAAEGVTRE